jgi:predicted NBD/HSP70 family sugar kinase
MSPATITRIIAGLVEQRIIVEERIGESNGGRRPVIFRLNDDQLFVAGIQILRDRVALAISDIKGRLKVKKIFQQYSLEPEALFAELATEFDSLLINSQINKEHILGAGLAISGIVDSEKGVLLRSVNLGWREVKAVEMLEKALGLQVFIENDANAAALAEIWFGGAKDVSNLLYIKTATGVGAGIIYERNLLTGAKGMAGEIGHIPLIHGGRPCRCGQSGCLETYLYLPDVMRRYQQETGYQLANSQLLFSKASEGDSVAKELIGEAIQPLAKTISFAEVLLDLEMIVIGGQWGNLGVEFLAQIIGQSQQIFERGGLNKNVIVKGSELGEDSDLLGAIGLVINEWFTPPI